MATKGLKVLHHESLGGSLEKLISLPLIGKPQCGIGVSLHM